MDERIAERTNDLQEFYSRADIRSNLFMTYDDVLSTAPNSSVTLVVTTNGETVTSLSGDVSLNFVVHQFPSIKT